MELEITRADPPFCAAAGFATLIRRGAQIRSIW
jgi:hypothetical protein